MTYKIELLEKKHDRIGFDCNVQDLNEFLRRNARQNQSNGISKTYVVIEEGNNIVRGFYTISSAEISPLKLP
ncbi:MAG: hypothetical protein ACJA0H_001197, partial [Francisellaceae bacterium]